MADTFDIGDVVVLTAGFRVGGVPTNPTAVTCTVKAPDGTTSTPTATATGVGVWTAEVTPTQEGVYHYRFLGTGAAAGAEEGSFVVRRSKVL